MKNKRKVFLFSAIAFFLILTIGFVYAGEIFGAICQCGYNRPDMFIGGGGVGCPDYVFLITGPRKIMMPALCNKCNDIVVVSIYGDKTCPACKSEVILYTDKSLQGEKAKAVSVYEPKEFRWEDYVLPDCYYTCPRCKEKEMIFYYMGHWN